MNKISSISALEVLDSRGNPTIKAYVTLDSGATGWFIVPSGASTGSREALELRDGDSKRFHGKGVTKAIQHITDIISPALLGKDPSDQQSIDNTLLELDGTSQKSNLGGNTLLAVSGAVSRAAAESQGKELFQHLSHLASTQHDLRSEHTPSFPRLVVNVYNGGQHANNNLDVQEFQIITSGDLEAPEQVRVGAEIFASLKSILKERGMSVGVGDEGGFSADMPSIRSVLDVMVQAITDAGHTPGKEAALGFDIAASEFFDKDSGKYDMRGEGKTLTSDELHEFYEGLLAEYPIISIEDPFDENDWDAWSMFMEKLGEKITIVGDDLLTTNPKTIAEAIDKRAANSVLVKPNQIGTISETLAAIAMAKKANWSTIISHRSGDTEDTFIADIAMATGSEFIKTGSMSRSERTSKYNRLIEAYYLYNVQ